MNTRLQPVVAESSVNGRIGIMAVLMSMSDLRMEVSEITDMALLPVQLKRQKPDLLIINPNWLGLQEIISFQEHSHCFRC